jgi:hypothetical protein
MKHLSRRQIESLVTRSGPELDQSAREHLAVCVECAERLAREARFESDLYDVAATASEDAVVARPRSGLARMWRIALPAAAALVVVVLGVRFLLPRGGPNSVPPPLHASRQLPHQAPNLEDPCDMGPGACVLPPEDVCRYATVEKSRHPTF